MAGGSGPKYVENRCIHTFSSLRPTHLRSALKAILSFFLDIASLAVAEKQPNNGGFAERANIVSWSTERKQQKKNRAKAWWISNRVPTGRLKMESPLILPSLDTSRFCLRAPRD